ncbi:flagella basal body P-ring formation protein FlgA [Parerythrobacter lacustris]|uniref:Flagella basal body P-ring formation protein FlgA n=1 Tax=Parerythrobacter lacustris TaxID=2969984 RepID=A0ABT1XM61_9SPHN|nr:flagella basal body P-ring formation protein FlgA [Parerythrobacter lacustris]MCR2832759.1 flagella basal body P-ring formation protein FlgA [Parerythrobacter lacustris]
MIGRPSVLVACTLIAAAAPALSQSTDFADPATLDAEVAAFTGAAVGTPGGAREPVDRRLRLARCTAPLQLAWLGRAADMVQVACPTGTGWRIFIPVNSGRGAAAPSSAGQGQIVVEKGQVLTIVVAGRGFSVSQQGEALEDGAIGAWIRIRPEGNREPVRARIETPQRAVIPLG